MERLMLECKTMKEDILEQLVEDWLQAKGYFTRANLKFSPAPEYPGYEPNKDCVGSDIDVIGVNPLLGGIDAVVVVGCKSWQSGFSIKAITEALLRNPDRKIGGKPAWKHFRELVVPKWTDAFLRCVREHTGQTKFRYVTAVAWLQDPEHKDLWCNTQFTTAMQKNPVGILTLREMLSEVFERLGTTVASSQFSRTLQLLKAARIGVELR